MIQSPEKKGYVWYSQYNKVIARHWALMSQTSRLNPIRVNVFFVTEESLASQPNRKFLDVLFNPLKPNDPYRGRTAPLTSKHFILYIYSTNIVTEYFKHAVYSPFFPLQNAVCFIILTYLVPVLFTFYI